MKVREVIRDPEAHGWRAQRHLVYRRPDHLDRRVMIAGNEGTDVPTGTPAATYRQAGIDPPGGSDALQRGLQAGRHQLGRLRPRPSRMCRRRCHPGRGRDLDCRGDRPLPGTTCASPVNPYPRLAAPPGWSTSPDGLTESRVLPSYPGQPGRRDAPSAEPARCESVAIALRRALLAVCQHAR